MTELRESEKKSWGERESGGKPLRLKEIELKEQGRLMTKIGELDRVLGGGLVPGEVVLVAGEPGVGKSTLLLGLGKLLKEENLVYISGEESGEQVKRRAIRLGIESEKLWILAETKVETIIEELERVSLPAVVVVDSVQTLWSEDFVGLPGSVSQVKGCTQKLIEFVKRAGIPLFLIGQINKEGEIAGPMMLSHMVDAVLFLEGERFSELRLLRGLKNRFGATDEVGVFKMTEKGMEEVKNPSEIFLREENESTKGEAGSVAVCVMEGTRPILLEVQALVTQSSLAVPRRVANGVDYNKVSLLAAVLQKVLGLPLYNQDLFVKVGGGFKVSEPAIDLGICLAIVSSFKGKAIMPKTVAFGEVGLLGEVRRVTGEERREKEAKKLGFERILFAKTVRNLREAVREAGLG